MTPHRVSLFARAGRDPAALIGLGVLAAMAIAATAGPAMLPEPDAIDLYARLEPPTLGHLLGTDELGRDVLARLLAGGRISLMVAGATALLAATIGTAVGLTAGYFGGRADAVLMRVTDGVMALPLLPLLVVLAAVDPAKLGLPGDSDASEAVAVGRIVVIIALVGWTTVARLVRGATLSLRARDHVRAAIAMGAGPWRIMVRHILPEVASPMVVAATLSVGNIILLESALSFLGLGVQPPLASWGNMLTGAMDEVWTAPLLALWPGLGIFLAVLAFNLLGEGLQTALDPRRAG
ncbi:MAG: ABC transporter permease [Magnetospirillum sp.]|nr:ABC transporter permease [Magnetospirillum sp.]